MGRGPYRHRDVDLCGCRPRRANADRRADRCDAGQAAGDGRRRRPGDGVLAAAAAISELLAGRDLARHCARDCRDLPARDCRGLARHRRPRRVHTTDRPQRDLQPRRQRGSSGFGRHRRLPVRTERRVLSPGVHGGREPRQHFGNPRACHRSRPCPRVARCRHAKPARTAVGPRRIAHLPSPARLRDLRLALPPLQCGDVAAGRPEARAPGQVHGHQPHVVLYRGGAGSNGPVRDAGRRQGRALGPQALLPCRAADPPHSRRALYIVRQSVLAGRRAAPRWRRRRYFRRHFPRDRRRPHAQHRPLQRRARRGHHRPEHRRGTVDDVGGASRGWRRLQRGVSHAQRRCGNRRGRLPRCPSRDANNRRWSTARAGEDSAGGFGYRCGISKPHRGLNVTTAPHDAIWAWSIVAAATTGVIVRPFRLPEAVWAVTGAAALVLLSFLPWRDALAGVQQGVDVYLFLIGMMLIAELARLEGLFDYLAALAVEYASGSPQRLFLLIYLVGTLVTVLLSNDATAIVLTPAVYAATRAAGAKPLPYLFVCAFIANAASFVLPISNPANLVVFGARMPPLTEWLGLFALPSAASILLTYVVLRLTQHRALKEETIARSVPHPKLSRGGKLTAVGIVAIGIVLVTASALDKPLGVPTFICGLLTAAIVLLLSRQSPLPVLRGVSRNVLPLVGGLFVMVEALVKTGVIGQLSALLHEAVAQSVPQAAWSVGVATGIATNIANNLPVGLVAGSVAASDHLPAPVISAILIGVDLGPNLSVTGSLATILWLVALRREKIEVGAWPFLKLGMLVTPPALIAALAAAIR